jgi:competence protein ComEC
VFGVLGALVLGIAAAAQTPLPAWHAWHAPGLLIACAVLLLIAARLRGRTPRWALALLCCGLLGAAAWGALVARAPGATLVATEGAIVQVEGIVLESPRTLSAPPLAGVPSQPATIFTLALRAQGHAPQEVSAARGRLRVRVSTPAREPPPAAITPGTRVRLLGRFSAPRPTSNPGEPDREARARVDRDAGTLTLSSWELATPVERTAHARTTDGVLASALALRERGRLAVLASLPTDPKARWLLSLLLLGESETRDEQALSAFARVGIIHLVAISGFHLTIIAMVALWLLRLLGDRGWLEPLLVALALVLYASLTPLSPALLRAVVLTLLVLGTQSTGRKPDTLCVLGLGAALLLLAQPIIFSDLGFQLSLGLTALLLWAQQPFAQRFAGLPPRGVVQENLPLPTRLFRGARLLSASSVMCWLVSLPWMMASVGLVSPVGLLASLLLAPVFVVLLVVGVLASIVAGVCGALVPQVGAFVSTLVSGPVLSGLSHLVMHTVRALDTLPLAWLWVPTTPWWWALPATGALALWARFGLSRHACEVPRAAVAAPLALALLALPLAWHVRTRLPSDVLLRIDMLDVGDGTCMLVRTRHRTLLWDAKPARWARTSPGVLAACRALGAWRVPTVAISHPDSDHCAGLPELLAPLGVRHLLLTQRFLDAGSSTNDQNPPQTLPQSILASLRAANISPTPLHQGHELLLGAPSNTTPSVRAEVLWPPAPISDTLSDNDTSLVLLFTLTVRDGSTTHVLLCGDVQNDAAREVAQRIAPLAPLAAIEAPHHGAANPGGIALLSAARARVVLQSTGPSRLLDPRLGAPRSQSAHWLATPTTGWTQLSVLTTGEITLRTKRHPLETSTPRHLDTLTP